MKQAIEGGDLSRIRSLLAEQPGSAHELIKFGEEDRNQVPPLHYVCDAVFTNLIDGTQALEMARAFTDAGVDVNEAYSKSGDTYLITAASLGAEQVGLHLLELGANVQALGLFRATALHWCAVTGLPKLAAALIEAGAQTDLADVTHKATPLEWAQHAWKDEKNRSRQGIPEVARLLGGTVPA